MSVGWSQRRAVALPRAPTRVRTWLSGAFRPFFLFASVYAAASMAAWVTVRVGSFDATGEWVAPWWHGHESLFGFVGAAIAGFLLTAVPRWTNTDAVAPRTLALLVGLWLAGRVAMWTVAITPNVVVAILDLAMWPVLAWLVSAPIAQTRNPRNLGFIVLLAALFVGDLLVHLQVLGGPVWLAPFGLHLGVHVVTLLMVVISGRIVPTFTANALRACDETPDVRPRRGIGRLAVGLVLAAAVVDLVVPMATIRAVVPLLAAVALAWRAAGWRWGRVMGEPLLWILHAGHAWLIVAFLLKAASEWSPQIPHVMALHALTAGAMGTMVAAVMSRAVLGHTGRPLRAQGSMTTAYLFVLAAGVVRVATPVVPAAASTAFIVIASMAWIIGYGLLGVTLWPMVTQPRVDAAR